MTVDLLKPAAITRSADHRYQYQGRWYPGVTGILDLIDKSGPLMNWAARNTAEAAVAQIGNLPSMLETSGPEGVVRFLTARSSWKNDEAKQLGTDVHDMADRLVRGEQLPAMGATAKGRVTHYAEWWTNSGWELRASEAMVVHPAFGYGGTLDLLCRDRDGRTVLADIKTGKGVYKEAVLQLTAYGLAELIQTDAGVFAMPDIDRYVVLHVTADSPVREVEINVGTLEQVAWGACCDLHAWAETMKGKRL